MSELFRMYREKVRHFEEKLCVSKNFDIIKKQLKIGEGEITLF